MEPQQASSWPSGGTPCSSDCVSPTLRLHRGVVSLGWRKRLEQEGCPGRDGTSVPENICVFLTDYSAGQHRCLQVFIFMDNQRGSGGWRWHLCGGCGGFQGGEGSAEPPCQHHMNPLLEPITNKLTFPYLKSSWIQTRKQFVCFDPRSSDGLFQICPTTLIT